MPQCFKIVQKVAFNIASEASNVYILRQTLFPDRSLLIRQKSAKNAKIQMRHFWRFSNIVLSNQSSSTNYFSGVDQIRYLLEICETKVNLAAIEGST